MGCAVFVWEKLQIRVRARLDEEDEVVLTGLEAAVTRIDDSSDNEPPHANVEG